MKAITLTMQNVRNIKNLSVELPAERGIYALVGENSCGKSTIMLALSLLVKLSSANMLEPYDMKPDSVIELAIDSTKYKWINRDGKLQMEMQIDDYSKNIALPQWAPFRGFYEGSIFYGTRFDDYYHIGSFMRHLNFENYLIDADSYVSEKLGYILHDNPNYYKGLKKIRNRRIAEEFYFKRIPYFLKLDDGYISQYRMSSGESMLLSLIDFINNLIIRQGLLEKNSVQRDSLFFFIDEVELALHPAAIDRLYRLLSDIVNKSSCNIVIYFSSHSSELIEKLNADHIFLIENEEGSVTVTNPCYPNYAIRNLYIPNGYDYILLVEDELAKAIVERVIRENNLAQSKLCVVLPAGGYLQILQLHEDIKKNNILGVGKRIISICDGDVKEKVIKCKRCEHQSWQDLPTLFLPIPSIEKYLLDKLVVHKDDTFFKQINDKYFPTISLGSIVREFKNTYSKEQYMKMNKKLYKMMRDALEDRGIEEKQFVNWLCDDIFQFEKSKIDIFSKSLKVILNK